MSRRHLPIALFASMLLIPPIVSAAGAQDRTGFGTLSIQVRPPDAQVFIDGERWNSPAESIGPLLVQLAPGRHTVEIRSPGRQTFAREVIIRPGETLPLNVSLTQGPPEGREPPPPPAVPLAPRTPPVQGTTRVTSGEDGFVIAPDFKIAEVDHETSQFIGLYGGYVFGGQVLLGAGAYWQANETNGMRLAYAGPVVQWRAFTERTIGFNLHALVGGGWQYATHGFYWDDDYDHYPQPVGRYHTRPYGWYGDGFFVAEPEAQVVFRFSPSARLQAGLGYRVTSEERLNGVSGSIGLQFGR